MKKRKKDLEDTIKDKVTPLLEEAIEKNLGVNIPQLESDITDQLKKPILDIYVPGNLSFKEAKKKFKKEFMKRELKFHKGNISSLAKSIGMNRRSIHRTIKDLEIDLEDVRTHPETKAHYAQHVVDQAIRGSLESYKEIFRPEKMKSIYQDIPSLSRNIVKSLPQHNFLWKEAEHEFEKEFISHALKKSGGSLTKAAAKLEIRLETLLRKVKKLHLKK